MRESVRLGIVFSYREDWIGGTYYLLNLINALKTQEENRRPSLVIFGFSESDFDSVKALAYPDAQYVVLKDRKPGLGARLINAVSSRILKRMIVQPPALPVELDVVYPATMHPRFRNVRQRLFWIPDFQEEYLPEMFGDRRVRNRRRVRGQLARAAEHIVFSSQAAAEDFNRFYPNSCARAHVLNFAVTHPSVAEIDRDQLKVTHGIGESPYFLVSNQFWKHKNHRVVLEAVMLLVESGRLSDCLVCFSGKEEDSRNPEYFPSIKEMVSRFGIEGHIRFLGFIDRAEQLCLMQGAIAVIQPSLFEGWSTVVEDAKALSIPVIASDLPVHEEQLGSRGAFFKRDSASELADQMAVHLDSAGADSGLPTSDEPYSERVRAFGADFINILDRVLA